MTALADSLFEAVRPTRFSELVGNALAKRRVIGLLRRGTMRPGIVLTGDYGTGKSSMARLVARALVCARPDGDDSCGTCDTCRYSPHSAALWGQGIWVLNCADVTLERLKQVLNDARYAHGTPIVVVLDEFHRATARLQDLLLTWAEDVSANLVLIVITRDPSKIDPALGQRLRLVKMLPPSTAEAVEFLRGVRDRFGLKVPDSVIEEICADAGNVLRVCLGEMAIFDAEAEGSAP